MAKKIIRKKIVRKVKAPKEKLEETLVERLIKKGHSRSFLTEDEILRVFDNLEDYVPLFEDFSLPMYY